MPDIASLTPSTMQPKVEDGIAPPNKRKGSTTVAPPPTCENCYWSGPTNNPKYVHCDVDLPPQLLKSNDGRKWLTVHSYLCTLWRSK